MSMLHLSSCALLGTSMSYTRGDYISANRHTSTAPSDLQLLNWTSSHITGSFILHWTPEREEKKRKQRMTKRWELCSCTYMYSFPFCRLQAAASLYVKTITFVTDFALLQQELVAMNRVQLSSLKQLHWSDPSFLFAAKVLIAYGLGLKI